MRPLSPIPTRYIVEDGCAERHGMAAYLASPLGRARARIAEIDRLSRKLSAQAHDVGIALTRGTGALNFAEITAETVRDLRIAAADLETFVRLHEAAQP